MEWIFTLSKLETGNEGLFICDNECKCYKLSFILFDTRMASANISLVNASTGVF